MKIEYRTRVFLTCVAITPLAGSAFAQTPKAGVPAGVSSKQSGQPALHRHLNHMAQVLDLTDSQKEQARVILRDAWTSSQPIRRELRLNRGRLKAAANSGADPDIQRLANEQGRLMGQLVAIQTRASGKIYQILTPEQRIKYDQMDHEFRQRFHPEEHNAGP